MQDNNESVEKIIVQVSNPKSNALGICALVFSILSLFFLAILFIPIALVLAVIALVKKQYVWAIAAIIICVISTFMSPSMWFLLAALGLK